MGCGRYDIRRSHILIERDGRTFIASAFWGNETGFVAECEDRERAVDSVRIALKKNGQCCDRPVFPAQKKSPQPGKEIIALCAASLLGGLFAKETS